MTVAVLDQDAKFIDTVVELGRVMHRDSSYADKPYNEKQMRLMMERALALPHVLHWWVLWASDVERPVGAFAVALDWSLFNEEIMAFDLAVFVLPRWRSFLTASLVIGSMEQWCKENNVGSLTLSITAPKADDVERVEKLYNRLGYRSIGVVTRKDFSNGR